MRRTELRQEVRKTRFEEACGGWRERRLTQEEAARMPGGVRAYSLSPQKRGFRRSVDRYEEEEGWTSGGQAPGAGVGASGTGR